MATIVTYESGAVTGSGGTTSGTVTTTARTGYTELQFLNNATADYARFDFTAVDTYSVRFYLHTPAAWSATGSMDVFRGSVGATTIASRMRFGGTTQPGRVELVRDTGTTVDTSITGLIAVSTIYRVLINVDTTINQLRMRVFSLASDTAIYDSGNITGTTTGGISRMQFGDNSNDTVIGTWGISRILVTNAIETIGRHATDGSPLNTPVISETGRVNPSSGVATNGSVTVTWPAVSGAVTYDAGKSTDSGATWSVVESAVTSPYTFTGLSVGTIMLGIKAKV